MYRPVYFGYTNLTRAIHLAGMCPGLREWWLQNGVLNLHNLVIFNIYTPTVSRIPCRHFVLCKVAGKTKHLHSY